MIIININVIILADSVILHQIRLKTITACIGIDLLHILLHLHGEKLESLGRKTAAIDVDGLRIYSSLLVFHSDIQ